MLHKRPEAEARVLASELTAREDAFPNLSHFFLVQMVYKLDPHTYADIDFVCAAHAELEARFGTLPQYRQPEDQELEGELSEEEFRNLIIDRQESPSLPSAA